MKVIFIGSTKRGYGALTRLKELGAEIVGIISLEQHASEQERYEMRFQEFAQLHSIPVVQSKFLTEIDFEKLIRETWKPDLAFAIGCRVILPERIYKAPRLGTVAMHDSLLPSYKGFAPLNWAIINGEDSTGISFFLLDETMDGGPMVAQKKLTIGPRETAGELYERSCAATAELISEIFPMLSHGKLVTTPQSRMEESFACSRMPADGMIHWERPTQEVFNLVRALSHPFPGAFTYFNRKKLWIWRAEPVVNAPYYVARIPGRVVGVSRDLGYVDVLTLDGILRINEVQLVGEPVSPAASVIKSVRSHLGISVIEILERLESLEKKHT